MRIIDYKDHFQISFEYNSFFKRNVEAVKNLPGHRWINGEKKFWWVPVSAARWIDGPGNFPVEERVDVRPLVEALVHTHKAEIILPENMKPEMVGDVPPMPELTIQLPWKEGVQLRPYQQQGVAQGIQWKRVLVGDDPGLGKTIQSIGMAIGIGEFPCLVVCPSSLKINWQREWEKFSNKKALVLDSDMNKQARKNWHQYVQAGMFDVVIVNYESVASFCVEHYPQERHANGKKKAWKSADVTLKPCMAMFRSGILDESHRCKEDTINSSKFILRIFSRLSTRILLSGTPVVNKPKDLYPQLAILGKLNAFGGKEGFLERYCEGGSGSNNLKELNYLLNTTCYFRREKKDVAKDLPDKQRQTIICKITTRKEYDFAFNNFKAHLLAMGFGTDQIDKSMKAEALVQMGELKKISAKGKLAEVKEYVEELMDAGEKVILFCTLHEIMDAILAMFPGSVKVSGRDGMEEKQRNIDRFQNDPRCLVMVVNMKAGGVGLTLTAASRVGFIEYPWTAASCIQCEDRTHRIGQKKQVMATYFLGENTIDEKMFNIILEKMKVANAITGSTDDMQMEMVDKLLNTIFE